MQRALGVLKPVQALLLEEADDVSTHLRLHNIQRDLFASEANGTTCYTLAARISRLVSYNSVAQARKLGACWQMVTAREATVRMGVQYSHVVRVRPDVSFPRPLHLSQWLGLAEHVAHPAHGARGLAHHATTAAASRHVCLTATDPAGASATGTSPSTSTSSSAQAGRGFCYAPCQDTTTTATKGSIRAVAADRPLRDPSAEGHGGGPLTQAAVDAAIDVLMPLP